MIKALHAEDQDLLLGIQKAQRGQLERLYEHHLPGIIFYIRQRGGTEEVARDIFQEAILVLYRKVESGDFELNCRLRTYLKAVCRNMWLKTLRDRKEVLISEDERESLPESAGRDIEARIEQHDKDKLYRKHFDSLAESCVKLLRLFFEKVPMKEIARRLDTSEAYVKKRKFQCKEQLVKRIKADPLFEELTMG